MPEQRHHCTCCVFSSNYLPKKWPYDGALPLYVGGLHLWCRWCWFLLTEATFCTIKSKKTCGLPATFPHLRLPQPQYAHLVRNSGGTLRVSEDNCRRAPTVSDHVNTLSTVYCRAFLGTTARAMVGCATVLADGASSFRSLSGVLFLSFSCNPNTTTGPTRRPMAHPHLGTGMMHLFHFSMGRVNKLG